MNAIPRTTNSERIGGWLGCAVRRFARREARAIQWLSSRWLPVGIARLLLWIINLVLVGAALYVLSWVALLLAVVLGVAWLACSRDWDGDHAEPEWRNGLAGFGLYTYDEHRIDPHVDDDD